jgi:hypothetical protein
LDLHATAAQLARAIRERRLVEFVYRERRRIGQPHVLGFKRGSIQLMFFQIAGETSGRTSLPNWRTCFVAGISQLALLGPFGQFERPRRPYSDEFDAIVVQP